MLKKRRGNIALLPKLGKKLLHFLSFSFSFVHNFLIALAPFILSHSFYFPYIAWLRIYHGPTVLFSIKKYAWTDENSKVLRNRTDRGEYRYASRDILSESLLCRPRMSPAENKRLEVHACSPRPHIVPSSSYTSTSVFFLSRSSLFLSPLSLKP